MIHRNSKISRDMSPPFIFRLRFLHLIVNGFNGVIDVKCGFLVNFCVVYLVKAQNHLISSNVTRGYFRSVWTAVYRFQAHLILAPKLSEPGKNFFVKHRCFV